MDHDDDEPVPFPWGNDVGGILGATAFCAAQMRLVAFLLYDSMTMIPSALEKR